MSLLAIRQYRGIANGDSLDLFHIYDATLALGQELGPTELQEDIQTWRIDMLDESAADGRREMCQPVSQHNTGERDSASNSRLKDCMRVSSTVLHSRMISSLLELLEDLAIFPTSSRPTMCVEVQ
jgi:hypothetical protein